MRFRPAVSAALLVAYLPACTAYHQTDQSLAALTAPPTPVERVRVTTSDSTRLQVWSPQVKGDSLYGYTKASGRDTTWVAVSLSAIRSTEVRKVDAAMTVGGVVLTSAAIVGLFAGIYLLTCDDSDWTC